MLSDEVMVDVDMSRALGGNPGVGADERRVIVLADMRGVSLWESPVFKVTSNR